MKNKDTTPWLENYTEEYKWKYAMRAKEFNRSIRNGRIIACVFCFIILAIVIIGGFYEK